RTREIGDRLLYQRWRRRRRYSLPAAGTAAAPACSAVWEPTHRTGCPLECGYFPFAPIGVQTVAIRSGRAHGRDSPPDWDTLEARRAVGGAYPASPAVSMTLEGPRRHVREAGGRVGVAKDGDNGSHCSF